MIISNGERQAPTSLSDAEPSHLARYEFASRFLTQRDLVLDVPCGSGYGVFLLSNFCKQVYGLDIYDPAIEHAKEFFSQTNAIFLKGDAETFRSALPRQDLSFDVVTSFEGIEHLKNPENFLREVVSSLKQDGKFIVSTPRKPHGSPYHFKEYTLKEYQEELGRYFNIEKIFGQIYTDIFDLACRNEDPYSYPRFNFIAICGQKSVLS